MFKNNLVYFSTTNLQLGVSQLLEFTRIYFKELLNHISRTKMLAFLKLEKFDKIKI